MKAYSVSTVLLVMIVMLVAPCPADDQRAAQLRKNRTTPSTKPTTSLADARKAAIQGKLSRSGGRVSLRLNRKVKRVEIFAGKRKLATLGGGRVFDVTPYLGKASATGLTFHYLGVDGRKSSQEVALRVIKALSRPGTVRTPDTRLGSGPSKSGRAKPASGRALSRSKGRPGEKKGAPAAQPAASGIPKNLTTLKSMTITTPKRGDFMVEGGQFVLQWSGMGNIKNKCVNLDLFQGISHVMPIARNVCVNGYNWRLPQGTYGINYKVRLRTVDNALMDDSDKFAILSAQPDLSVSNFRIRPAKPDMADPITVSGIVQNNGHGTSGRTRAVVRIQSSTGDWSIHKTVDVPSMAFGPNAHRPFSLDFGPIRLNEMTVVVQVDDRNQVIEANENNNTEQLIVQIKVLPNLRVCVNEEIRNTLGETRIPILVQNYSFEPAGPSICRVWVNNHGSVNHNVPSLAPFEKYRFTRKERFRVAGWRSYSATIDTANTVRESLENDNEATGRIHAAGLLGSHPVPLPECK